MGCSSNNEPEVVKEKYVKVEEVNSANDQENHSYSGILKEKSLTSISFRVAGPLQELKVKSGDRIEKGQIIARIDQRDYQLQLQSTLAQFNQTSSEYKRYKVLMERKTIPQNTFERVESTYLLAKTAYENAINQLKDTDLIAPVSGYIHEKMVENFQTVSAGQPIVSIVDLAHIEVVVNIPESKLNSINLKPQSYVSISNIGLESQSVKLLSVAEKTSEDGLYEVKYVLDTPAKFGALPGMTAELNLEFPSSKAGQIQIPMTALFNEGAQTYVWVYNASQKQIQKRKVEVKALENKGRVSIKSGLRNKEVIVIAGVNSLSQNQKVKPLKNIAKSNVGGLL
jgi:RND family efflux transporter MFP subunit